MMTNWLNNIEITNILEKLRFLEENDRENILPISINSVDLLLNLYLN